MTEEAWRIAAKYAVGINECAAEIDALIAAAVRAEQDRCAQIASAARRKYRNMDAFIADEIYQDIRGSAIGRLAADSGKRLPAAPVVLPRPTAGDVERARSIIGDAANIVGGPEALREMLCKDIAVALSTVRAEARAELLAQIRGPTLHRAVAQLMAENLGYDPKRNWRGTISDKDFPQLVDDICDALADKLTEAK